MNVKLPDNVLAALTVTQRATGWNFRPADTIRFDLPNGDGTACRLLVVPYRRWASRRWELQAERQHQGSMGSPPNDTSGGGAGLGGGAGGGIARGGGGQSGRFEQR